MRLPHRKATWALVIWTVGIVVWLAFGLATRECQSEDGDIKEAVCTAGTAVGVGVILVIGFMGFVTLSLLWLMSRPRERICPTCGRAVKAGLTACPSCGHDFASTEATAPTQRGTPDAEA
jgi:hypothetical protein